MFTNRYFATFIHIAIWLVYLMLPLFILPQPSQFLENDSSLLTLYFINGLLSIGFFYFNYYFSIPKYYFKRKFFLFFISTVVFVVLSLLLTKSFISYGFPHDDLHHLSKGQLLRNSVLKFVVIFIISMILRFNRRLKQTESEKIKSELQTLKAQINPHFLFNILNDIYGQAIIKSEHTANSIAKLSSMMRYVLTDATTEKVPLENEINYLKSYIELQKIRLTNKTEVVFEYPKNVVSFEIPPLLFISFVENAFKYGVSNETKSTIFIKIKTTDDCIVFQTKNDKFIKKTEWTDSNNIGLKNTRRRLDLIYGNKYLLDVSDHEKTYQVNLKICPK